MAKKPPIRQFYNNYMPTPRKTTATIALDSRLGLRNQPVCSISPSITTFHCLT
ncbi:hypothetical protein COO91_03583 [Nostoc flagelliforme CCNUN1]|uniref:Uncharacterized protein n=1 Tax=Nostoc flagelliforme CCNUN1 TaxID=2038116 RepID=A0A2K8SQC5_9NOSO|nr:hypothetical protein COO91_03583 [Nostoc flagelliforme CCNUN1]